MRFFHIIKTGGESLELHLEAYEATIAPKLNYSHCRQAASASGFRRNLTQVASPVCAAAAAGVSAVLCGLNCECCAADARVDGGFHGVLVRSPRAHLLSLFTHCHTAHVVGTYRRALADVPQYAAEAVLRSTEWSCGTYCGVSFEEDWQTALREGLRGDPAQQRTLRVLPLHNTQAHALTCSTSRGSLGQHFRVLDGGAGDGGDSLEPSLEAALASLHSFEWVGLTDLFEHSLCLLHYQAAGAMPTDCRCEGGKLMLKIPRMNHGVIRHDPQSLDAQMLAAVDAHTAVDAQLFAAALRLLLGRLQSVEERSGTPLLQCVNWPKLHKSTAHIPGLWAGPGKFKA